GRSARVRRTRRRCRSPRRDRHARCARRSRRGWRSELYARWNILLLRGGAVTRRPLGGKSGRDRTIYLVLKRHAPGPGRVGGRLRIPLARSRQPDTGAGCSAVSVAARAAVARAVSTAVSTAISSAVGSPLTTVRWGAFFGVLTAGCSRASWAEAACACSAVP